MKDWLWNILEKPNSYLHIKDDDVCSYAREYVAGGYGYIRKSHLNYFFSSSVFVFI